MFFSVSFLIRFVKSFINLRIVLLLSQISMNVALKGETTSATNKLLASTNQVVLAANARLDSWGMAQSVKVNITPYYNTHVARPLFMSYGRY